MFSDLQDSATDPVDDFGVDFLVVRYLAYITISRALDERERLAYANEMRTILDDEKFCLISNRSRRSLVIPSFQWILGEASVNQIGEYEEE